MQTPSIISAHPLPNSRINWWGYINKKPLTKTGNCLAPVILESMLSDSDRVSTPRASSSDNQFFFGSNAKTWWFHLVCLGCGKCTFKCWEALKAGTEYQPNQQKCNNIKNSIWKKIQYIKNDVTWWIHLSKWFNLTVFFNFIINNLYSFIRFFKQFDNTKWLIYQFFGI